VIEVAVVSFTTFFATIGPLDVGPVFAAMTPSSSLAARRRMAVRGTLIATGILLTFALAGDLLLASLGISLAALRVAGGILLLLIAIDMVFARTSGGTSTTEEETREGAGKSDVAVFPLATPLIAGPGAMGAVILLMAEAQGDVLRQGVVIGMLLVVLVITLASLLLASQLQRLLGVTGLHVVSRVFGVLLAALAVQFMIDGIRESGLVSGVGG
jgi:multiple antibiotic resistance protein